MPWRRSCGQSEQGWCFTRRDPNPVTANPTLSLSLTLTLTPLLARHGL
jgi:hypothetical protein